MSFPYYLASAHQLSVVVCGNPETLELTEAETDKHYKKIFRPTGSEHGLLDDADTYGVDIIWNATFALWNGGNSSPGAYVRLAGFGKVDSPEHCISAIAYLLGGGGRNKAEPPAARTTLPASCPDGWPTAEQVGAAFDMLDAVLDVSAAPTGFVVEGLQHNTWDTDHVTVSGDVVFDTEAEAQAALESLVGVFVHQYDSEDECRNCLRVTDLST